MIHDDRTFYFILYNILKFIFHVNFEVVGILRKCVNSTKTIIYANGRGVLILVNMEIWRRQRHLEEQVAFAAP